jgi:hypothetical protein
LAARVRQVALKKALAPQFVPHFGAKKRVTFGVIRFFDLFLSMEFNHKSPNHFSKLKTSYNICFPLT